MTKITLPIKCSTVKKANSTLVNIINVEILLAYVLGVLFWVSTLYRCVAIPASSTESDALILLVGYFVVCVTILCFLVFGVFDPVFKLISKLYNKIPSLECINDDEVKP